MSDEQQQPQDGSAGEAVPADAGTAAVPEADAAPASEPSSPQRKLDPEEGFAYWYADGQRRTYGQVAARFKVAYNTVRKAADVNDWDGRADALDARAREMADKRLAKLRADATLRIAEVAMTGIVKFTQRLPEQVRDPKNPNRMIPNPHALEPGELSSADLLRFVKVLESVGVVGSAEGEAHDELRESLESLRTQVAGMYEAEVLDAEDAELLVDDGTPALPPAAESGDGQPDAPADPESADTGQQVQPQDPEAAPEGAAPADGE